MVLVWVMVSLGLGFAGAVWWRAGESISVGSKLRAPTTTQEPHGSWVEVARSLCDEGEYRQAIDLLESFSATQVFDSSAECVLARAESGVGDLAAAEASYRRAIASDPSNSLALYGLGRLLVTRGREDEGRFFLDRHQRLCWLETQAWWVGRRLEKYPTDAELYVELVNTYRMLDRPKDALLVIESARERGVDERRLEALGQELTSRIGPRLER